MKDTFCVGDTVWLMPSSDFKFDRDNCYFGIGMDDWNAMVNRNPHKIRQISSMGNFVLTDSGYYWPHWAFQHDEPIAVFNIGVEDLI